MAGLLSGLDGLGLGNLENMDIYEDAEKKKQEQEAAVHKVEEKDFLLDRSYECPVCGEHFTAKMVKTGKAKLIKSDPDLRPQYEGIDMVKYDVALCPNCGYAALTRYFSAMTAPQARLIKENISEKVRLTPHTGDTYTYEEALERYKLTLANAVVKRARASEKAYICLKSAWLMRGYAESLAEEETPDQAKLAELKAQEEAYLQNAYNGFVEARQTENSPICGMDEITVDYLLAVLASRFKKFDVASRMIANILTSHVANNRIKDKARDLKEQILTEMKKK